MGTLLFIFLNWKYAWLHIGAGLVGYWIIHLILKKIALVFINLSYEKDPCMTGERYKLQLTVPLLMMVPAIWFANKALPMIIPLLP